jgi:hypothetical protein
MVSNRRGVKVKIVYKTPGRPKPRPLPDFNIKPHGNNKETQSILGVRWLSPLPIENLQLKVGKKFAWGGHITRDKQDHTANCQLKLKILGGWKKG